MKRKADPLVWVLILAMGTGGDARSPSAGARLAVVSRSEFCVTEGALEELPQGLLSVTSTKMRAYLTRRTEQAVEARFTYQGPTNNEARLGSGALRRQFGLKLRAQDACNLVYAMWRIEPTSKLVVSVKNNPGQHRSAECGNRGYRTIRPSRSVAVSLPEIGQTHTLLAVMEGAELRVFADGSLVWEGSVGAEAMTFDGPVGMRSDNVRLTLTLSAGETVGARSGAVGCGSGSERDE